MDLKHIRSFFKRLSKERLLILCKEYRRDVDLTKTVATKDVLCGILCEEVTNGRLTVKDLEMLDIRYREGRANNKWLVYRLLGKKFQKEFSLNDPECLQVTFEEKLKIYLNCKVCVLPVKNALWIRICAHSGDINSLLSTANTFYMVHVPGSAYILLSTLKVAYKLYVLKAIENLFGCEGVDELDLTGKKVGSLSDLVLNQTSQGAFSHFRLNQVDNNPISRKRKRELPDENTQPVDDGKIFNEQWSQDKKSRMQTLNTFGSNPQPLLEKVVYKMETRFRGLEHAPGLKHTTVKCVVEFRGTNVLEGIKNLVQHGLASQPLPAHLTNVHSLARNHFILTDKQ